jgi:choline monooxygenase
MNLGFDIDADIRKASTPPGSFYTDPAIFEASKEKVFARSWQFVTEADTLRSPGHVHPFTLLEGLLDEPLVFTRDKADKLHCVSNVCTHRANIVCEGDGNVNSLRCRYHGRRFGLDGKMTFMPEFDGVEGFPSEHDNLAACSHGQWRKFLFASLQPSHPLDEVLKDVQERVGWLPIEEFRYDPNRRREYLVKGHWALYVDNYLEGFHIPYVHSSLNEALDYGDYETQLFQHGNLQLGVGSCDVRCFDIPASSPDHGQQIAAYYYWIYPNLMLNFYPWGLSINVVRPLGPALTKVTFIPFVWHESLIEGSAGEELDRVEREDEEVVELVQKGLKSRLYHRGRYSPEREKGTHQFHQMLIKDLSK